MNKRLVLSIFVVAIMTLSSSAIAVNSINTGIGHNRALGDVSNTTLYNITFNEHGLTDYFPGSNIWYLQTENSSDILSTDYVVNSSSISLELAAGNYKYFTTYFFTQPGVTQESGFTVNGNMTINVTFTTPVKIVFKPSDYNSTIQWGVSLSSSYSGASYPVYYNSSVATGNQEVTLFSLPAVYYTYSYSWFEAFGGIDSTMGSGQIQFGPSNSTVLLPLEQVTKVEFKQNSLPSGTEWEVQQTGGPFSGASLYNTTRGTILNITVAQGTDTFAIYYLYQGYQVQTSKVTVNVVPGLTYTIDFPELYMLNVSLGNKPTVISVLSAGVSAQFNYGGTNSTEQENSTQFSTVFSFLVPNGTITLNPFIEIDPQENYYLYSNPVTVTMNGSDIQETIAFDQLENMTLQLSGLPSSLFTYELIPISGNIHGLIMYGSVFSGIYPTTTDIALYATNGSYQFNLELLLPVKEDINVSETVLGPHNLIPLEFANITLSASDPSYPYEMEFITGPHGNVILSDMTFSSTENLYLLQGDYSYSALQELSVSDTNSNLVISAQLQVTGTSDTLTIPFTTNNKTVSFTVNDPISSGYSWEIYMSLVGNGTYINGQETQYELYGSVSGKYNINVLPGTYIIEYSALQGSNGTVYSVNSTRVTIDNTHSFMVNYSIGSYLTLEERGLPSGSTWQATVNGVTKSSNTDNISFSFNNTKDVNFTVSPFRGYYATPGQGTFTSVESVLLYNSDPNLFTIPVQFTQLFSSTPPLKILNYTLTPSGFQPANTVNYFPAGNSLTLINMVYDPQDNTILVSYQNSSAETDGLMILNASSMTVLKNIQFSYISVNIYNMELDSLTNSLYILSSLSSSPYLIIVNLSTFSILYISIPGSGSYAYSLVEDAANNLLYVATSNGILAINPVDYVVEYTIKIPLSSSYGLSEYQPLDLMYSSQTGMLYATGYDGNTIYAINPEDNSIAAMYNFTTNPNYLYEFGSSTLDPANGEIYSYVNYINLANSRIHSEIKVFSISTGTYITTLNVPLGANAYSIYDAATQSVFFPSYLPSGFNLSYHFGVSQTIQVNTNDNSVAYNLYTEPYSTVAAVDSSNGNVFVAGYESISEIIEKPLGNLAGSVNVPGATVEINGVQVSSGSSFNFTLLPGNYLVTAFAAGYNVLEKRVTVYSSRTTTVNLDMNASRTSVLVTGKITPGLASLTFNGISAQVSNSGQYMIYLPDGEYTISAYLIGYLPFSETERINGSATFDIAMTPEPPLTSSIHGKDIVADGFGATVSNLTVNSSNITLDFSAKSNSTLVLEAFTTYFASMNISEILNSHVYVNSNAYSNYTITIDSNGTVFLRVNGLSGDPMLSWYFGNSTSVQKPHINGGISKFIYVGIGISVVIVVAGLAIVVMRRSGGRR